MFVRTLDLEQGWQADHCRELAQRQTNAAVMAKLLQVASEYEELAEDANERCEESANPV